MPNEKLHRIHPDILQNARDLRHPLTPAEKKIWRAVRDGQLSFKIRRQHPVGRYIADFYCAEARLVIEIDGESHLVRQRGEIRLYPDLSHEPMAHS
jgi:leucyl-tRNA synthetase